MDLSGQSVGPYQLVQRVAESVLGFVYQARNTETGELFALKHIRPDVIADGKIEEALRKEVGTVAALHHDVIAAIFGLIQEGDNTFLVTEWVAGENLAFFLLSHGPMTLPAAAELIQPIFGAMAYAHGLGICNGWLESANVLVTPAGPKLINFGMEWRVEAISVRRADLTDSYAAFMPPEWYSSQPLDQQSDIYMLGVLLFQMLTGKQHPLMAAPQGGKVPCISEILHYFDEYLPLQVGFVLSRAAVPLRGSLRTGIPCRCQRCNGTSAQRPNAFGAGWP